MKKKLMTGLLAFGIVFSVSTASMASDPPPWGGGGCGPTSDLPHYC